MYRLLVCCVLLILGAPAPLQGQDLSPRDRRAIAEEVTSHLLHWLEQLRNRNIDGALAIYGRRETFVHIENGNVLSWPELAGGMRAYLDSVDSNEIYWEGAPNVLVLGSNVAVVHGAHAVHADGPRGRHRGLWTGVFERREAGWKLVHSHSSDVPEP